MNKYKVISKAYTDYEAINENRHYNVIPGPIDQRPDVEDPFISDPIDVEFVVEASDVKQAEAEANDYMLHNYGHEAYNIDTDITEVK
jgi:hypothetical protein